MTFKHSTRIPVRFVDGDIFGHVNNANYLTYIEEARVGYFDTVIGYAYDWNSKGIILAKAEIDYIRPIVFKDTILVRTKCTRIGVKSLQLDYRILKITADDEQLMATASTVLVAYDYVIKQSITIPDEWRNALLLFEDGLVAES